MTVALLFIALQIIFLEGILSIDNAAVLGTMAAKLPANEPVPWPARLKKFGLRLNPFLGSQQNAALRIGLLGAYAGRVLMLLLATVIIHNPWLKVLGALYLIYLACENLGLKPKQTIAAHQASDHAAHSFWHVVLSIEIADLVFSLDNVVAAVSLTDHLWVVLAGVAVGMVLMRYAAGIFRVLITKEPILQKAAFLLILNIGAELIAEEIFHYHLSDYGKLALSLGTIGACIAYAHMNKIHRILEPVTVWLRQGFYHLHTVMQWGFEPVEKLTSHVALWLMRGLQKTESMLHVVPVPVAVVRQTPKNTRM